jgi:hypothetical protein
VPAALALMHPEIEEHVAAWLAGRKLSWQQLERGEVKFGERVLDVTTLQLLLIHADPVLFAESYFIERDGPYDGESWRFFDYQKPSMRYRGDTLHECGAEVGKTREIVALAIWMLLGFGPRSRGELLIGAAQDGHLDSIWDQLLFELRSTPALSARVDWDATRVKPYRKMVIRNGNIGHLRPAGYDGETFRGLHCSLAVMGDEVAKWANPKIFDEFFRAALPGSEMRLYSTPDGNRASRFYGLCQQAQAVDLSDGAKTTIAQPKGGTAVKFRWSKPQMPPPFWTKERRAKYIEQYGGVDSPGYQQNVLGNWGDAANSVFPWEQFEPCTKYVPEFVEAKILWNDAEKRFYVTANRLNPLFSSAARLGDEEDRGPQALIPIVDEVVTAERFDLAATLRGIFSRPPGHLAVGIDCGSTDDPTEIIVSELRGRTVRDVARLQLKRFNYPAQRSAIRVIDEIFAPDLGYGLDATGIGTGLEHLLNEGEGSWSLDGKLTGFVMNGWAVDFNPETGEPVLNPSTGKERKATYKEIATRLLQLDVQRREYEAPKHPEWLTQFTNHTARVSLAGNRVFDNTNDHLIEAKRVQRLRLFDLNYGSSHAVPIVHYSTGLARPVTGSSF